MLESLTQNYRSELDEIQRRLYSMIQIGKVAEVNPTDARLKVSLNGLITTWLPWLTHRAGNDSTWWVPEVGEQVVVLAMGGELADGVVLPAIYQTDKAAPDSNPDVHVTKYSDGTTIKYDRSAHSLSIDVQGGDITINTTNNITINAGDKATVTTSGDAVVNAGGNVNVDGTNINLNGGAAGGVVCQQHVCAFTGSSHPVGSSTVKGAV